MSCGRKRGESNGGYTAGWRGGGGDRSGGRTIHEILASRSGGLVRGDHRTLCVLFVLPTAREPARGGDRIPDGDRRVLVSRRHSLAQDGGSSAGMHGGPASGYYEPPLSCTHRSTIGTAKPPLSLSTSCSCSQASARGKAGGRRRNASAVVMPY